MYIILVLFEVIEYGHIVRKCASGSVKIVLCITNETTLQSRKLYPFKMLLHDSWSRVTDMSRDTFSLSDVSSFEGCFDLSKGIVVVVKGILV